MAPNVPGVQVPQESGVREPPATLSDPPHYDGPVMRSRFTRPRLLAAGLVALVLVPAIAAAAILGVGRSLPPVTGVQLDQPVPPVQLLDASGRPASLASFHGRYVVLAPFLTLCHEVCPITTGAYLEMQQVVAKAGLADRVAFVEVTVDPGRDVPARLRAYAQLTGSDWALLTGSAGQIATFWKSFGVGYEVQPIGSPAPIDWWTHQPETYDVAHSDGLFFLDPSGHERIAVVGTPDVGGKLNSTLTSLLDQQGLQNLHDPQAAWTVPQALDDLGHLLGQRIPVPSS